MDYNTLIVVYSIFFGGMINYDDPGSHQKIDKNTQPSVERIYKPINMENSIEFVHWSNALSDPQDR